MSGILGVLAGSGGSAPVSYTGPGDLVSGALAWWGMRAYSSAARGGNVCDILRASDSTTQTFISLSDGSVDLASITSFLASTTGVVTKLYDQTGNGLHVTDSANSATAPALTLAGLSSKPVFTSVFDTNHLISTGTINQAQPFSCSGVYKRTGNFTANRGVVEGVDSFFQFGSSNSADNAFMYAGNFANATATDSAWHAVQGVFNGASSAFYIDGSTTSVNAGTGNATTTRLYFPNNYDGQIAEGGIWPGDIGATNAAALNSNQHTYWGF